MCDEHGKAFGATMEPLCVYMGIGNFQVDKLSHDVRAQQRKEADGCACCEARHGDYPPSN